MKHALILVIALTLFVPATSMAVGKSFWSSLKSRIQGITPKKQASVTTAVGGVRGAASEEADAVYWKGKEVNEVNEVELQKFNDALNLAVQGDSASSLKAFEAFLKEYPDSFLRLDALDAVAALRPEAGESAAPAEGAPAEQAQEAQGMDAAPAADVPAQESDAAPAPDKEAPAQ